MHPEFPLTPERLRAAYDIVRGELLARRTPDGHWTGRLSGSALSTATAVSALSIFHNSYYGRLRSGSHGMSSESLSAEELAEVDRLIRGGVARLVSWQNHDGGWGDTDKSPSNISTTLLVKSALILSDNIVNPSEFDLSDGAELYRKCHDSAVAGWSMDVLARADAYIHRNGGIDAVRRRYGKDQTFSTPILTNAALAGLIPWKDVSQLPFERAALPQSFFRFLNLQVVSYAVPALVAIGRVRFHYLPERYKPLRYFMRRFAVGPTLRLIRRMQPESGGYLEAAPLTAFVVMSLVACGALDHPVVLHGLRFLLNSSRADGSWPIDTNLATWGTSLAVAALGREAFADDSRTDATIDWLLSCQHRRRHPFTGAEPGGWGWTDLSGAVPDGDDTPGALLALAELWPTVGSPEKQREILDAVKHGFRWLLKLQNRDGGMPTFCRGWGMLPFDQSSTDLTAHAIRAVVAWTAQGDRRLDVALRHRLIRSVYGMVRYLERSQNKDGSWFPLWFGNQHRPDDVNPFYGTAKVLRALNDLGKWEEPEQDILSESVFRALSWILANRNADGSWGGDGTTGSIEETAVILETLADFSDDRPEVEQAWRRGLNWLLEAVESGRWTEASPIGLYFAKLWYFEDLYPVVFTAAALRSALKKLEAFMK